MVILFQKILNTISCHPPFSPSLLVMRYHSGHHGDKLFDDAVAIEAIVMLVFCACFSFSRFDFTQEQDMVQKGQNSSI